MRRLNKETRNKFSPSYNFLKKNRKADMPITILVFGVFAVCTLAVFSFFHSTLKFKDSFSEIDLVKEAVYKIHENSLEEYFDEKTENKFEFSLEKKGFMEKIVFSVEYLG
jgi:hypothetical protein